MAAPTSKNQICDMALSHMGNYGSVNDIDNPKDSKESTFALWYDVTRQSALRLLLPNFALARRVVAEVPLPTEYTNTYSKAFERPADCLKVLGIGQIDSKTGFTVEGNLILVENNDDYADGLPIRFVLDITDVTAFTPDFKILFSIMLAANTALAITQKQNIKDKLGALLPMKMSELSGTNAQENPPIRISRSKFKEARYSTPMFSGSKR